MSEKFTLHDLMPKGDPKGGSPKSPVPPMSVSDFESQMPDQPSNPCPPSSDFSKLPGFFHMQFRDVLYAVSLVIVGLLFIFQRQSDVKELSNSVTSITKTVDQLVITVDNLKKIVDTNSSDLRLQALGNIEQDRRISTNEQQLITLVPDMREIRTKLNFVADLLDDRLKTKR